MGVSDLQNKIIRVTNPANADEIFTQDPLRILRAVRQSAQLDFEIEPQTKAAMTRTVKTIHDISTERVREELDKILETWQHVMDENDDDGILAESVKLAKHHDPEVRASAVEGLAWIGPKGVVALTDMLYDKDPGVAKDAAEAWLREMRDMEDGQMKSELLSMAAGDVDKLDEDTLLELLSLFHDIPEHAAALRLFEMLKTSQNPDYIREILDTLNFVIQPDDDFDIENMKNAVRQIEAWLADPKNQTPEQGEDGE